MHITEIQYLNSVNSHINAIKHMHDLTVNFRKMLQITNTIPGKEMGRMGTCIFIRVSPSFPTLISLRYHYVRNVLGPIVRIGFWPS